MIAIMFRNAVKQNLAGQLFVRMIEVPLPERKLGIEDEMTFLELPFDEAVAWFKQRFPEDTEATDFILRAYVRDGKKNTELMRQYLAQRAKEQLDRVLSEGGSVKGFVRAVQGGQAGLGIEPISHSYLETVFRTQTQSAYGAGRYRQITSPAVVAARPYVEYRTALDSSVRPAHRKLDGLQFRTADPAWKLIAPPNGYNCRCQIVTLDASDLIPGRLTETIPKDAKPDPGFDGPPTDS